MQIKISINGEKRTIVIPLEYDESSDSMTISQVQVDPIPNSDEDISNDIVFNLTKAIFSVLQNNL